MVMRALTKIFAILAFLATHEVATAEPVMQNLIDQEACNKQGFYYDHSKDKCSTVKVLTCNDQNLKKLLKAKATNFKKWHKLHAEITKNGYSASQCFQQKDSELVVNYVRKGMWPEFKTVRVLTH